MYCRLQQCMGNCHFVQTHFVYTHLGQHHLVQNPLRPLDIWANATWAKTHLGQCHVSHNPFGPILERTFCQYCIETTIRPNGCLFDHVHFFTSIHGLWYAKILSILLLYSVVGNARAGNTGREILEKTVREIRDHPVNTMKYRKKLFRSENYFWG